MSSRPARVSSTSLIHLQRNRYSVPSEYANRVVSVRLYPEVIDTSPTVSG
jgi:hypothetical protein